MKITKENILEITGYLEESEALRPLIGMIIDKMQSFGTEIEKVLDPIGDWIQNKTISTIKKYEAAGFSRSEAILLTIDSKIGIKKILDDMTGSKKK